MYGICEECGTTLDCIKENGLCPECDKDIKTCDACKIPCRDKNEIPKIREWMSK